MKKFSLICSLGMLLICCKNKENKSTEAISGSENSKLEEIKLAPPTMGRIDDQFIQLSQSQKENLDLTNMLWHYSFALSLKEAAPKENIYKGQWLDLLPKGEYKKGLYGETTETGRYIFDEKTTFLELRSTTGTSSEWKVKVDPATMILIGTAKYSNNPWQIKLSRVDTLPGK
ncbi:MAG: hypothetical protein IPO78_07660 [Saprospiraceae bacterium]|nr:hypothetical protein [Saprospiraceae bacterium]MBK8484174.1 hypothetical protein [Saprospiraceae bacterium]MBK9721484.1 hypothetical protein [Saprospiraceae bacterium]